MAIQSAEDLFLTTLSHLHAAEGRVLKLVEEMSRHTQNQEVKDLLTVRAHLTRQEISNIEECFKLLGKQPVKGEGRIVEVFAENFNRMLNEIQTPEMRALFVLYKVRQVQNLHIAEYAVLTLMATQAGYYPVAILLDRNFQDKVTFVERCDEVIAAIGEDLFGSRMARRAA